MSDDLVTCYNCNTELDSDSDRHDINERIYCEDCVSTCSDCSEPTLVDDMIGDYCTDCGRYCDRCDSSTSISDTHDVNNSTWCEFCYDNYSFFCEPCGEAYDVDDQYNGVQGEAYCNDCYSDNCYYCDDCSENFRDDDPCDCRNEGGSRCRCGRNKVIHDYSCKPEIEFHGTSKSNLYMGFELETRIGNNFSDSADYASRELQGVAILKSDSSIGGHGFEIVTQPHTHAQYRDNSAKLWQVIDTLRTNYEARSWDTDTCGLHIHVSRAGFSSKAHMHRFIAFIYKNAEVMMKFAGRKSTYARFNDVWRFDEYDRPYFSLAHKLDPLAPTERYSAVNTQNRDTIELRFFRGTMNPSGVLSALDLTQAGVEYTRDLRLSDVKLGALSWDWFVDYVQANNGLYPDLYSRIGKVQQVDINKKTILHA